MFPYFNKILSWDEFSCGLLRVADGKWQILQLDAVILSVLLCWAIANLTIHVVDLLNQGQSPQRSPAATFNPHDRYASLPGLMISEAFGSVDRQLMFGNK